MKNANQPNAPLTMGQGQRQVRFYGLSKREEFAARAMQGFIAAGCNGMPDADCVASYAIEYANALLAALEKGE